MYHEYPYTTYFHDIDKMCECCKKAGYRLEVSGDYLKLIDEKGNVISNVQISYAEKALTDVDGTAIQAYIVSAYAGDTTLMLKHGNNDVTTITIPYASKAGADKNGNDITGYVKQIQVSGDKIQIVQGDSVLYEITVPYAVKASTDTEGKDLTTYAAVMAVDGDELTLSDSKGRELARLTVPYATRALNDGAGDKIESSYGNSLLAGSTTVSLMAKDGTVLDTITVPYATKALTDTDGNNFVSDYAERIVVDGDGRRVGIEAHDGTRLATITVPFATLAEHATAGIETVQVIGDQLVFTTHGGQSYTVTAPYAVKAQKDDNGNTIKTTYVANVDNDSATGALRFYDAVGNLIATLTPTVTKATQDSMGNVIADYIKSVAADEQSDFITFTHGNGDADTITIPYAIRAWQDSLAQPIQNTYLTLVTIEPNEQDPTKMDLVGWNGDIPRAKVFATPLDDLFGDLAFKDSVTATYTPKGTVTSTFTGTEATISGTGTPEGTIAGTAVTLATDTIKQVDNTGSVPYSTYDSATETLSFVAGEATTTSNVTVATGIQSVTDPTFMGNEMSLTATYTPEGTVSSTFAGTKTTITSK